MSSSKIIKNGRIVTAIDDYIADILIENERITVSYTHLRAHET